MIPQKIKERLKKNWGDKAKAMDCFCEVKFIDVFSDWDCYVYALNPDDEDTIMCIIRLRNLVRDCVWTLSELHAHYNTEGEFPTLDSEFRPIRADVLYKRLKIDG